LTIGSVRTWDLGPLRLLANGPAASPRAELLAAAALQRLWRLRIDGLDVVPEVWPGLMPHEGWYTQTRLPDGDDMTTLLRPRHQS
jgi:hypothetical protein